MPKNFGIYLIFSKLIIYFEELFLFSDKEVTSEKRY